MIFPDYRIFKPAKKIIPPVTDQDVDYLLQKARRSLAGTKVVEREARKGDRVKVDYEARDAEGIVQMLGQLETFVLGQDLLFPEFDVALLGHTRGDKVFFQCSIPSDYFLPSIRGKSLHFAVELLGIEELNLPPEDDDLALKIMGEGKTLKDLKDYFRQELDIRRKERARDELIENFFDGFFEALKDQVTEEQIMNELNILIELAYLKAEIQGISREEYDARLAEGKLELKMQLRPQAHRNVALRYALDEIFKKPEFQVDDQLLMGVFEHETQNRSSQEQNQVKESLKSNPQLMQELRRRIQMEKLFHFIEN